MSGHSLAGAIAQAQQSVARHESQNAGDPFRFDLTEHRYVALRDLLAALSTPPADDVREALAAARNVEQYLDMLAIDANDPEDGVIDDGYDVLGVIQSLAVPDLRSLIAFVREVRPHGTVTDAERQAVADAIDNTAVVTPRNDFLGGSTIANLLEVADAALEAAREVHP